MKICWVCCKCFQYKPPTPKGELSNQLAVAVGSLATAYCHCLLYTATAYYENIIRLSRKYMPFTNG